MFGQGGEKSRGSAGRCGTLRTASQRGSPLRRSSRARRALRGRGWHAPQPGGHNSRAPGPARSPLRGSMAPRRLIASAELWLRSSATRPVRPFPSSIS
jgi:hypothetical protein